MCGMSAILQFSVSILAFGKSLNLIKAEYCFLYYKR